MPTSSPIQSEKELLLTCFLENQISDYLNTFLAGLLKKASDAGGCAKTTCRGSGTGCQTKSPIHFVRL